MVLLSSNGRIVSLGLSLFFAALSISCFPNKTERFMSIAQWDNEIRERVSERGGEGGGGADKTAAKS